MNNYKIFKMPDYIDKVAWIEVKDKKLLMTRSHGTDAWYLPGGKREAGETDTQTLQRETHEELNISIDPATATHYGTFEAQAHGKPEGTLVRAACYMANYTGTITPGSEIAEAQYLPYSRKGETGQVAHALFDDLHQKGLIE